MSRRGWVRLLGLICALVALFNLQDDWIDRSGLYLIGVLLIGIAYIVEAIDAHAKR